MKASLFELNYGGKNAQYIYLYNFLKSYLIYTYTRLQHAGVKTQQTLITGLILMV